MRKTISVIIMIIGIILGFYVGGWVMFIHPIIYACQMLDAGTLTFVIVGTTILKCLFASCVGVVIAWIGWFIAAVIND